MQPDTGNSDSVYLINADNDLIILSDVLRIMVSIVILMFFSWKPLTTWRLNSLHRGKHDWIGNLAKPSRIRGVLTLSWEIQSSKKVTKRERVKIIERGGLSF